MRISSEIEYDGAHVYAFDPQKVLVRMQIWFPRMVADKCDLAQAEIERFTQFLADNQIEEPRRSRLLDQIHGKAATNGPAYDFTLELSESEAIQGQVARYEVFFAIPHAFRAESEHQIVAFLESLAIGTIRCDTQTQLFSVPDPVYRDFWQQNVAK